ncbi:hypothetical protein [Solicola gregarius]|uniref:Uncharacterized protein n=1 Tax=Solicola gregarius TaxID=2908642 RepID=A0AA46YLX8_9ACTN|nr:hypothetical protein [Solicola gregarius]UYM07137.1 hypothetical protein L0C25_08685 [Solicola gregarius]
MTERTKSGFAPILRSAIADSGLSLERIQARLAERGVDISVATLSYWQSGRSEPGRRASVAALPHIEELLGLSAGQLQAHLGRTVRTRTNVASTLLRDILDSSDPMSERLLRADSRLREMLNIISDHCTIHVDESCRMRSRWVRRVLISEVDGADRFLVLRVKRDPDGPDPTFEPLVHCSAGETYTDHRSSLIAQEVLLDRVLDRGESIIVEYALAGPPSDMEYASARRAALRELVLEIQFDPDALPTACELVQSTLDGADEVHAPIALDDTHCLRVIRHNLPPGRYAVRWTVDPAYATT